MFLDYLLIASALWVCFKSPSVEAKLLLTYFFGSILLAEILLVAGYFNELGKYWLLIYAAWIAIFVVLTRNALIARLYAAQQLLCLLVLISWNSTDIFYNVYSYLTAIFYLLQLGLVYGSNSTNFIDDWDDCDFYLAHNRS